MTPFEENVSSSSLSVRLSSLFYYISRAQNASKKRTSRPVLRKGVLSAAHATWKTAVSQQRRQSALFIVRLEKTDRIPPFPLFGIETARESGVFLCVRDDDDVKRRRKPSHLENDDA